MDAIPSTRKSEARRCQLWPDHAQLLPIRLRHLPQHRSVLDETRRLLRAVCTLIDATRQQDSVLAGHCLSWHMRAEMALPTMDDQED